MSIRNAQARSDLSNLQDVIRQAYSRESIDRASLARIRSMEANELLAVRLEVARDMLDELITQSTTARLYPGGRSVIPLSELHDEVISSRLALDLVGEVGANGANVLLSKIIDLISVAFADDYTGSAKQ